MPKPPAPACALRLLWVWVTRYPSEVCQQCGRRNGHDLGDTWWHAHGDLWDRVVGGYAGVLCPRCFTRKASSLGIKVAWEANDSDAVTQRAYDDYGLGEYRPLGAASREDDS